MKTLHKNLMYDINRKHLTSKAIICGMYYKNIAIVNEASRVIREWCHNLEHKLQSSIMLLELSIVLQESSIILLENILSTGVTHDDCIMFKVQATSYALVAQWLKSWFIILTSRFRMGQVTLGVSEAIFRRKAQT